MSLIILSSSCSNIATTTPTIKYEATNFEEAIEEIKNSNISFNGSINKTVVYDTTLDPLSETITRNIDISYDNKLFRKNDDFYKIKKDTVYKAYLDENLSTY